MKKLDSQTKHQDSYQQNVIRATAVSHIGINNDIRLEKAYGSLANRIEFLNKIQKHSAFTKWWFSVFFLLGILCLALDFKGAWFNVLDLYIVMVDAYLIARNKVSGMYIAIIECLFYAFICYRSQLFGEVAKALLISIPLYIYALISWNKARAKRLSTQKIGKSEVIIKKLTKEKACLSILFAVLLSFVCYLFLKYCCGQQNALILSSMSLAIMILGRILTANHYMENYIVFIINGFVGLGLWIETIFISGFTVAALSMIIYRVCLILNDIHSYGLWKAMHRRFVINNKGFLFARRKLKINKIIKLRRQYKNLKWNREIDMVKNT